MLAILSKTEGLSDESIKFITTSNEIISPSLDIIGTKVWVNFSGDC